MSGTNPKIPIGGNYFISSTNYNGLTRCHIRYHKMCYDQNNQITYQPTKFGVSLTHGQLVNIGKNINIILSEMETLNAAKTISSGSGYWNTPNPESEVPQTMTLDCLYQDLVNNTGINVANAQAPATMSKKQTFRRKKVDGTDL